MNIPKQAFVLTISTIVLLYMTTLLGNFQFLGVPFSAISIVSDIQKDTSINPFITNSIEQDTAIHTVAEIEDTNIQHTASPPNKIVWNAPSAQNTLPTSAPIVDTATFVNKIKDSLLITDFDVSAGSKFQKLFQKLAQTQQGKKVRIAYFGDSMIEGDLVTQDLRKLLQQKFGGNGVGYVPITSITSTFRNTIGHTFRNWTTYSFENRGGKTHPLCPSGYAFVPTNGATVNYRASNYTGSFQHVKLYYGATEKQMLHVAIDGKKQDIEIEGKNSVNELDIPLPTNANNLNFSFNASTTNVYGTSFEGKASQGGVWVDNYAFRGNSGLTLTQVPEEIHKNYQKLLNYDLIILQYGVNVLSHNRRNYTWYQQDLSKVIQLLKRCYPEAAILIVGIADRGYRMNGTYQSEPDIPYLLAAQKNAAKLNAVGYWSLFENMGGQNSMVQWVNQRPALANKDYIHFTPAGASVVGKLVYNTLLKSYEQVPKTVE